MYQETYILHGLLARTLGLPDIWRWISIEAQNLTLES